MAETKPKFDITQLFQNEDTTSSSSIETTANYKTKKSFNFIIFGIGSLLAWNVIISDIDFFDYFQDEVAPIKPAVIFPFLNFAPNIIFQFILVKSKKMFTYKSQIIVTLILLIICMILLPLVVVIYKPLLSFYISCAIIFIQGLISAINTSSFFGLISYFKTEYIVLMSTGQGVSGILMNVIKYILIFTIPRNEDENQFYDPTQKKGYIIEGIIYYSIAVVFLIITLIVLIVSYENENFLKDLKGTDEFDMVMKHKSKAIDIQVDAIPKRPLLIDNSELTDSSMDNTNTRSDIYNNNTNQSNSNENDSFSFMELIKKLLDVNLLIMFCYIVTFAVFPSALLQPELFDLHKGLKFVTLITLFNVFDTIGRKIISLCTPNKKLLYVVTIGRTVLVFLIPFNYYLECIGVSEVICGTFLIGNSVLLGLTNGISTSLAFALAPMLVEDKYKGKSGASVSFFDILGIFIGTLVAFGMNHVMEILSELKGKNGLL